MIKLSLKATLLAGLITLFSGCGSNTNDGENVVESGLDQFVSAELIDDINASVMLAYVKGGIDENATNAFSYRAVKIIYNTINEDDKPIQASGLLVIPTPTDEYKAYLASMGKAFSVSMVCDNHGTIFTDAEAPSNVEVKNGVPDYDLATLISGYAGFAGIFPDYIGYGISNGTTHPYMLKKSSTQSSLDMIKASIKYMTDNNIVLNYQLYLSGYSQGGYNTLALAQKVEDEFNLVDLKAVAPMDGPYNIKELADIEIDANHTMVYPAFLAYLTNSYTYYYDDLNLEDIVVETNTTLFRSLFDGTKNGVEIQTSLGLTTNFGFMAYKANALFKDSAIVDYQNNENSIIKEKFIENQAYSNDWIPKTKLNLIHCIEDDIIPFSIANSTFNDLNKTGADVTLTPIPTDMIESATLFNPFVHGRCASTTYGVAIKWFNGIRSGEIK